MRWATYQFAATCTGREQPGTVALMVALEEWVSEQTSLGIYNCRDIRGGDTTSLHGEGRAYDCGLPTVGGRGNPIGYGIVERLGQIGDVAGIQLIIFDRKKWSLKGDALPYTGLVPHYDHLHIELNWWGATNMTLATWRAHLAGELVGDQTLHVPVDPSEEDQPMRYIKIVAGAPDPNVYGYTDDQWWVATAEEPGSFGIPVRGVNARQRDIIRSRVLSVAAAHRDAIDLVKVVGEGPESGRTIAIRGDHWWEPDEEELGSLAAAFGAKRIHEVNQRQLDVIQARLRQLATV
jgi:hypothetical protein